MDNAAASNWGVDPKLVDFAVLSGWMDAQGLLHGDFTSLEPLASGTQNMMFRFSRGSRAYVLRRPPPFLRPASNEVIRREMRLLAALSGKGVRNPGFIAGCADESVMNGAVFYLMEPVDGFNASVGLPPLHAGSRDVRRRMGFEAIDAIAELGAVDHAAAGLADFGKPDGFLERQVPRWMAELDGYGKLQGYPGPQIPRLHEIARWLETHTPHSFTPGIMHGDYHFSNVMFDHQSARLAAIVDWEMATIGDPLLDLGWILSLWPGTLERFGAAGTGGSVLADGLPSRDEVIAHYAARTTRDMAWFRWYEVLACFKLGIVLEGTHARACAGRAPKDVGDRLHATTLALFGKGAALIDDD
jgi:aminoglycoside phosphotransferase (APT) family kinase protein